jgi:predicted LPLAT superfamily acyltransferase
MTLKGSWVKQGGWRSMGRETGQKPKSLFLHFPLSTFFSILKSRRRKRRREYIKRVWGIDGKNGKWKVRIQ